MREMEGRMVAEPPVFMLKLLALRQKLSGLRAASMLAELSMGLLLILAGFLAGSHYQANKDIGACDAYIVHGFYENPQFMRCAGISGEAVILPNGSRLVLPSTCEGNACLNETFGRLNLR